MTTDKSHSDPSNGSDPANGDNEPDFSAQDGAGAANASAPSAGAGADQAGDGFVAAEGPDIETSFSDDDLSFLENLAAGDATAEPESDLAAERLLDLQRVTAEYANYRKRTEANREVERERTTGDVVAVLLPILDDLDRAEKHGDLVEGSAFATIAQKLRGGVERMGATKFAAVGEVFDPQVHEAIFQQPADVEVATIADVVETGYTLGSTLLRAAKVVVSVPND